MKKKTALLLISAVLIFYAFGSCSESDSSKESTEIKFAEKFSIEYLKDSIKVITDADGREFLLLPDEAEAPEGYETLPVIRTPIKNAFFMSTTHIGLLDAIGVSSVYDSVAAVATEQSQWTNPNIIDRFSSGKLQYIEQTHWSAADIEAVTKMKPDVVFVGGGNQSGTDIKAQMQDLGITYVVVSEYLESSGTASLEWIKFFAAFYNLDSEAAAVFEAKTARMNELHQKASELSEEDKPLVAFGLVWDGTVYVPSADSTSAKEIGMAGGRFYLPDLHGEGSLQIGMEEFVNNARDADILIYTSMYSYAKNKQMLLDADPLFAEFKAFKNNQIYVYRDDFYMNSAAIDEKFEDMVFIIHPEFFTDYELKHFVKLTD